LQRDCRRVGIALSKRHTGKGATCRPLFRGIGLWLTMVHPCHVAAIAGDVRYGSSRCASGIDIDCEADERGQQDEVEN
jgi:hypothetical protein